MSAEVNIDVVDFLGIKFPQEKKILKAIIACKDADQDHVETLKKFLFQCYNAIIDGCKAYEDQEWKEDPEVLADQLLIIHSYLGGLMGLADSLHRRIKSKMYIDLLSPKTEGSKALAHDAREYYARLEGVDIEGVVTYLNQKQINVFERIQTLQGKMRRR